MDVQREILIFKKEKEILFDSFLIFLTPEKLIEILHVNVDDDPLVYKIYEIDRDQYKIFCKYVPELSNYDFDDVDIFYECFQV